MRPPRPVLGEEAFRQLVAREADRATRYQDFFSVCLVKPDAPEGVTLDLAGVREIIAGKIAESLRSTDVVAQLRDGAAFLLLNTASGDAVRVAERVRTQIENVAFPGPPGAPAQHITLSVGEVSFPQDGSNDRLLLSRAEAYLKEATRRGGNQIVGPDDPDVPSE
jgi:diguanylate cyclase (GGDEF)-like protein